MVEAHDCAAVKWDLIHEIDERFFNFSNTAMPVVEVFFVNIRHNPNCRNELQKTSVALIRFGNEVFARTKSSIG